MFLQTDHEALIEPRGDGEKGTQSAIISRGRSHQFLMTHGLFWGEGEEQGFSGDEVQTEFPGWVRVGIQMMPLTLRQRAGEAGICCCVIVYFDFGLGTRRALCENEFCFGQRTQNCFGSVQVEKHRGGSWGAKTGAQERGWSQR